MIRDITINDAAKICDIYNYYIVNTIVTFEESKVSETEMMLRIEETTKKLPWIVFEKGEEILGYACASQWKSRCAYKYSLESTVYLKRGAEGDGIGSQLYGQLIDRIRNKNYHAVIGGISLPNTASIALHEKFGFEKIAHFKEVGYKFDKWIDVGYWELIL